MPPGTDLEVDDEFASVETIKVNLSLPYPVKGKIVEVNAGLQESPEWINQDPYGRGWMSLVGEGYNPAAFSEAFLGHCGVIACAGTLPHSVQEYLKWTQESLAVK